MPCAAHRTMHSGYLQSSAQGAPAGEWDFPSLIPPHISILQSLGKASWSLCEPQQPLAQSCVCQMTQCSHRGGFAASVTAYT